jgi:hypothetical protein
VSYNIPILDLHSLLTIWLHVHLLLEKIELTMDGNLHFKNNAVWQDVIAFMNQVNYFEIIYP